MAVLGRVFRNAFQPRSFLSLGFDFHVPVVEIALILIGAYLATLLTTFLPARAAAQVAPAEALRYE